MRVLVAGGGTGGHFYPALAIAEGLKHRYPDAEIDYIGTKQGIEARVLADYPWIRFHPIHVRGLSRRGRWRNVFVLLQLVVAFAETLRVFLKHRPTMVVGVGGYSSFPPVFLAAVLGRVFPISTMIHEQNVLPGVANRWLSRFVDLVLISFSESKRSFPHARKIAVTGNPIREEFLHVKRSEREYRWFGLDPARRTILVFGGSKGSDEITEQIRSAKRLIAESPDLQTLLVTGDSSSATAIRDEMTTCGISNVVVTDYVERMGAAFAIADLVVCRAGATSLAEITACGKASILVPWREATDDHQWENARRLEQADACALADDEVIVSRGLVGLILDLMHDEWRLARVAGNAARLGQGEANSRVLGEIQALMRGAGA